MDLCVSVCVLIFLGCMFCVFGYIHDFTTKQALWQQREGKPPSEPGSRMGDHLPRLVEVRGAKQDKDILSLQMFVRVLCASVHFLQHT